jgi:hypothetical protein
VRSLDEGMVKSNDGGERSPDPGGEPHAVLRGLVVELDPLIVQEWRDDHCLSRRSLMWVVDHAEVDDPHPIASAIAALRMTEVESPS